MGFFKGFVVVAVAAVVVIAGFGNRLAAHFVHQAAGNGAANQTARHQAVSGGNHRHFHCTLDAVFIRQGVAIGSACTVPARERNRACNQADERVLPQRGRQADAHEVLHQNKDADDNQKGNQWEAALFEAGEVGRQTDGREKHQHKRGL